MDLTNPFVLGALGALVAMAAVKLLQNIWTKYVFDHRNAKVADYIRSVQQKIKDDQRKASYSLPIPKGWYKVCCSNEIKPGQVKEYTICESILAVYRSEDGKTVGVLDADCPHLGANMAIEGKVVGDCLQCPFHLIEFGADGKKFEFEFRLICGPETLKINIESSRIHKNHINAYHIIVYWVRTLNFLGCVPET
jgi:nitrite reductase/ring-hydroxylating ferredoxin subunit